MNGIDAVAIESQNLESFNLNDRDLEARYHYDFDSPNLGLGDNG